MLEKSKRIFFLLQ